MSFNFLNTHHNIADLVGNTPLVEIRNVLPDSISPSVRIFAKLEQNNPSGSVKARAAVNIIREAEQAGTLKPGMTLLDVLGKYGYRICHACSCFGIQTRALSSQNANQERKDLLRAYGAEIIYTSPLEGSDGAIIKARALAKENPDWSTVTSTETMPIGERTI